MVSGGKRAATKDSSVAPGTAGAKRPRSADGEDTESTKTVSSGSEIPGPGGTPPDDIGGDHGQRESSPPWGAITDPIPDTPTPTAHASGSGPRGEDRVSSGTELQLPDGAPPDLRSRITALLNFKDVDRDVYALKHLPRSLQWAAPTVNPKNRYLCRPGTKRPVTIWVPGVVTKLWLFDLSGNPHSNAAVTIAPASAADMAALRALSTQYSTSKAPLANPDELRASCWQSRAVRGRREQETVAFDRLYDATRVLRAKAQMMRLPAEELHMGDWVLQEATVTRYAEKGTDGTLGDKHRVSFEMQAVYLLLRNEEGDVGLGDAAADFAI
ncbi:hypothetical protein FA95DRAFT_1603330 [Auriscalpium vulgare]|uniref:Uncharacterized protein n=1 Tax=Auriscalpium vulgare TaxID=40419 RepID=A0ACB8S4H0_9AGAM|nr:hypothetical protein FA95DRAFT_1603330 [Auriscalpium vulgare]